MFILILFLKVPCNILCPEAFLLLSPLGFIENIFAKQIKKTVSEIKWWTPHASPASTHSGQDPKIEAFSPTGSSIQEQEALLKSIKKN